MSRRKRFKIKQKQKLKRHKRLEKLKAKNLNISNYFYDGRYLGSKKER